jgi:hypothetical protein
MVCTEVPAIVPVRTGRRPGSSMIPRRRLGSWLDVPAHFGQNLGANTAVPFGFVRRPSSPGGSCAPSESGGYHR